MTALAARTSSCTPTVEELVAGIETEMTLAAQALTVDAVLRIEERFQELRRRATGDRAVLSAHMERLRELRSRFEQLKAPLAKRLVDELLLVRGAMQDLEAREAVLRESVIWLSRTSGQQDLKGDRGSATVRPGFRHSIPETGTEARTRLENLIREHGLWERVSILNASRIAKAIDAGSLAGSAAEEVMRLCPSAAVYAVRVIENRPPRTPTGAPLI